MDVLVIGGTRFIGVAVVEALLSRGHHVTIFHRGVHPAPTFQSTTGHLRVVLGDRAKLGEFLEDIGPVDAVVDTCATTRRDALAVVTHFGDVELVVTLSSIDVYYAFEALYGAKISSPIPLTEASPLRRRRYLYGNADPDRVDYDNLDVEDVYGQYPTVPSCLLRLPVVYGPRDYRRREWPWICRVLDQRVTLPMAAGWMGWLMHRVYVDDVAQAVALCLEKPERARGQTFNLGEEDCLPWSALAEAVAVAAGGRFEIVPVPQGELPPHLHPGPYAPQPVVVSTRHIRQRLGYKEAMSREACLRATARWHIANPPPLEEVEDLPDYAAEEALLERLGLATA